MQLRYEHLLGRPFVYGESDCFSILRDFFQDNFSLEIPNFARPVDFWKQQIDLYGRLIWKVGFRPLDCHPREYRPGDVFLHAIKSTWANHGSVLVDHAQVLHHLEGRVSELSPYNAFLRNTTIGVYRHPAVKWEAEQTTIQYRPRAA
jgi:hypothetical protein